uniref:Coiled-coil domain containing 106a n=1 Tax=Oreochromis aureus TaxID=47969 RepID=A0AAZ1XMV4_OREAU
RSGRSSQRGTNRHTEGARSSCCAMDGAEDKNLCASEKLEWQKKRIEELEGERDFLRSQLSSLTSMKLDLFHKHYFYFTASENSDSSSASSSVSSVWSSSSSSPKKRKHKYKKKHSRLWQLQTPNDIVQRYKSLLKTFPKAKTMTKAFQKHGLIRNTVVSTSSVGELAIAVPNVYQELLSNRPSGETVLAFAKRCEAAIQGSDEVKNKIESMKAAGTLLPICKTNRFSKICSRMC